MMIFIYLKSLTAGIRIKNMVYENQYVNKILIYLKSKHTRVFHPRVFALWCIAKLTRIGFIRIAIQKAQLFNEAVIYKRRVLQYILNRPKLFANSSIISTTPLQKSTVGCGWYSMCNFQPSKFKNMKKHIIWTKIYKNIT